MRGKIRISVENNYLAGKISGYTMNNTITSLRNNHDMVFWNNKGRKISRMKFADQVIDTALQQYVYSKNWTWNDNVNWGMNQVQVGAEFVSYTTILALYRHSIRWSHSPRRELLPLVRQQGLPLLL